MKYNKEMSLNAWSQMFLDIYYPAQNYGRPSFEVFTHIIKVFGAASHYLFRVHDPKGSRESLAKVFAWYCALANRLELNIEDTIWQKYPAVCSRCLERTCQCTDVVNPINVERLSEIAFENHHQRPNSLRDWQIMFAMIYRGPSGKTSVPQSRERILLIFARIVEELGEVAESLTLDSVVDTDAYLVIKNEMADLAAWIFALANNLHAIDPEARGVHLADIAWELYPGKCHRCLELKCICVHGTFGLELAEKGAMAPSHWDERTGLANDKALRRYLQHANKRFLNNDPFWSIIFLDLDDFGAINKKYSHQIGDEVLRVIAKCMRNVVGKNGIVFRKGGEEFTVVSNYTIEPAMVLAERIRKEIANSPVIIENDENTLSINVTVSVGVAASIGSIPNIKKLEEVESAAESNCKEAKNSGKNKVIPTPTKELILKFKTRE